MSPLKPWMRIALWIAGAMNVIGGIGFGLLRRDLFRLAGLEQPNIPLPLQMTGCLMALLGIGIWMVARKPRENRGILTLAWIAHAGFVVITTYNVSAHKVPTWLGLLALLQFGLFVVLLVIARHLQQEPFEAGQLSHLEASRERNRFPLARFGWGLLIAIFFVPAIWSSARSIEYIFRAWNTPKPPLRLRLTPVAANLPRSAPVVTPFTTEIAFPHLRFEDPTFVVPLPDGSNRLLVLERPGRIQVFTNSPEATEKKVFLDITDRVIDVQGSGENGLNGIALHPEYAKEGSPNQGVFFLHYTSSVDGNRAVRLAKFRVPKGSDVADPKSEVVLINQPDENPSHDGGTVLFGPDGFLYFTIGDDDVRHPNKHAQYIDRDLFSGILRIDVDQRGGKISHPPPRQPLNGQTAHYFIPNDNPFVGMPNVLEEFYAIGFRNPWRASFDRGSGKLWVTDIGERRREEVSIVENGSNCGWSYVEGTLWSNSHDSKALGRPEPYLGKETWPVYEYERDAMHRCIIGGYVYHGVQFPELQGKYVYADMSGRVFAITTDKNDKFVSQELQAVIEDGGHGIASFAEDLDGELLMVIIKHLNNEDGEIRRLVPATIGPDQQLPERLSETGLFTDLKTLKPIDGFVPFEVNNPLWSDRATKLRWIGLPGKEKIKGKLNRQWTFPEGTVFLKHFDLPLDERDANNSAKVQRLETRVLVLDDNGAIYGGAYRWNEDLTDAFLVDRSETEEITYTDANGQSQTQTWFYPGRFECMVCHNPRAGFVLGFNARQLNRDVTVGDRRGNQLVWFAKSGMFERKCDDKIAAKLPRLAAIDDASASVETRVRSYLDSNCSHCHRPQGYVGRWDGRFERPLDSQRILDAEAIMHRTADADAKVVAPGDLDHSYLYIRMASGVPHMQMPPMARNLVDDKAVQLVAQWIESMPPMVAKSSDDSAETK